MQREYKHIVTYIEGAVHRSVRQSTWWQKFHMNRRTEKRPVRLRTERVTRLSPCPLNNQCASSCRPPISRCSIHSPTIGLWGSTAPSAAAFASHVLFIVVVLGQYFPEIDHDLLANQKCQKTMVSPSARKSGHHRYKTHEKALTR